MLQIVASTTGIANAGIVADYSPGARAGAGE